MQYQYDVDVLKDLIRKLEKRVNELEKRNDKIERDLRSIVPYNTPGR